MILTAGLLLVLINHSLSLDETEKFQAKNKEELLHDHLLKDYQVSTPPPNITTIEMFFILSTFFFDSEEVSFTIISYVYLNWTDERLKWNPDDHAGITVTQLRINRLWTPVLEDLTGYVRVYDGSLYIRDYAAPCQVKSSGLVTCLDNLAIQSSCNTDLTNWPYDLQTCFIKLAAHLNYKDGRPFKLKFSKALSSFSSEHGPGWDLLHYDSVLNMSEVKMHFILERMGVGLDAMVVTPSVVLSVLTVVSLFLDTGNTRLGVVILSLLSHLRLLYVFSEVVPKHGSSVPSALRFLNGSMAFTTVAGGLTFLLSYLRRKTLPPPRWVCTVNEFFFKGSGRFLVWPRWELPKFESVDAYNKAVEDWTEFANVISSVALISAVILYLSFYLAYIPREVRHHYELK